ncbi:MAG: DUF192 domain-containing protein [Pseudomonadota bacterium]
MRQTLAYLTRFLPVLVLLFAVSAPGTAVAQDFHTDPLIVDTGNARHFIAIEVADTPPKRAQGLMNRETMAQDAGMLFDFKNDRVVTMWMKNTILSLDMIFIDKSGSVIRIAEDTVPFSETTISSGQPVRYVLEVNAGVSRKIGLEPGDTISHPVINAGS